MEFTHFVHHGPWRHIWIAAHFERKIKAEEVFAADIGKIIESVRVNRNVPNLRHTGHLLVGTCRMYQRKTEMYEVQVGEVKTRIHLAYQETNVKQEKAAAGVEGEVAEEAPTNPEFIIDFSGMVDEFKFHKTFSARPSDVTIPRQQAVAPEFDLITHDIKWKEPYVGFSPKKLLRIAKIRDLEVGAVPNDFVPFEKEKQRRMAVRENIFTPDMQLNEMPEPSDALFEPEDTDTGPPMNDNFHYEPPNDPAVSSDAVPCAVTESSQPRDSLEARWMQGNEMPTDASKIKAEPGDNIPENGINNIPTTKKKKRLAFGKGMGIDDEIEIPQDEYMKLVFDRSSITVPQVREMDIYLSMNHKRAFCDTHIEDNLFLVERGKKLAKRLKTGRSLVEVDLEDESSEIVRMAEDVIEENQIIEIPDDDVEVETEIPILEEPSIPELEPAEKVVPYSPLERDLDMSMGQVVTGGMDEEKLDGTRVGFSSRTQKMESLVRQEIVEFGRQSMSYNETCAEQSRGSRHLVAACFFELLVLKTNGVIEVKQDRPFGDIGITQGHKWNHNLTSNSQLPPGSIPPLPPPPAKKLRLDLGNGKQIQPKAAAPSPGGSPSPFYEPSPRTFQMNASPDPSSRTFRINASPDAMRSPDGFVPEKSPSPMHSPSPRSPFHSPAPYSPAPNSNDAASDPTPPSGVHPNLQQFTTPAVPSNFGVHYPQGIPASPFIVAGHPMAHPPYNGMMNLHSMVKIEPNTMNTTATSMIPQSSFTSQEFNTMGAMSMVPQSSFTSQEFNTMGAMSMVPQASFVSQEFNNTMTATTTIPLTPQSQGSQRVQRAIRSRVKKTTAKIPSQPRRSRVRSGSQ